MRRNPVTVPPTESVSGVMFRMVEQNIGAVIVVEKGRPVGIITERNILERVLVQNLNVYQTQAKEVMSTPLVSIESDRSIREALDLMRQQNIRRLAVTENDALVGLVTERRLLTGSGRRSSKSWL
jgi:CBS domain-containing protein